MKAITILFILFLVSFITHGQPYMGEVQKDVQPKAANCVPPSHSTYMEYNNVRMLVHTAGNLWQVPALNLSVYEVPKNSGIMALFTAALWLGGTDVNGQLKLAALRYRNGQDYWTGPLTEGEAEITADECSYWDRHFITTQDEVRKFDGWYQAGVYDQENGTNTQATNYPEYVVPDIIKNWPAHGNEAIGQSYYLAPFYDNNEDGHYNWQDGDYPWHDINKTKVCKVDRDVTLYGDLNYWWIMNDKGNIHTETLADPIGMEIRAQAFCFASNDEVNNMTFYNYELINRGTQTLQDTYFGSFTDGALGDPFDDYVGCDVNRGLGYYYNGNNFDADNAGFYGYGDNPPAVGVDFFEGPYQDNDGIDNAFGINENEALNGIGYGDGIIDNERFGMRRFLYYSNTTNGANPAQTDPTSAEDYYNYLKGFWKDGTKFIYGGSGHVSDQSADINTPCDFMFPGDTDPLGWGTNGQPQEPWTEQSSNNTPNDRRFVQSAGPFVLKPGAVNNITVGVVWARATNGGDPFASVEKLRRADDKAQALFENCFKVLDAPHAPTLEIQELNNELILTISNPQNSNNANEEYIEFDPFIAAEDSTTDQNYRFQGYQIFQLESDEVSLSDLEDPSKARLVAQCDIKDDVSRIINFEYDDILGAGNPVEKVDGENEGIRHSFLINEDLFSQGDRKLVNFKTYYYMAVAYAYNNYKTYDPTDPESLDGQTKPYIVSRKAPFGEVRAVSAVPHNPIPESDGTYQLVDYGVTPEITRLDGHGNGNRNLEFTEATLNTIVSQGYMETPTYTKGNGPILVKVIDPLNVQPGYFTLGFHSYIANSLSNEIDTAQWTIYRHEYKGGPIIDSVQSEVAINRNNEQLIPEWGVSVQIEQHQYLTPEGTQLVTKTTNIIKSSISFSDSSKRWLSFISDTDFDYPNNWVGAGISTFDPNDPDANCDNSNPLTNPCNYYDWLKMDNEQAYEKIVDGGISHHKLVRYNGGGKNGNAIHMPLAYTPGANFTSARKNASISYAPSVNIVLTDDQTKWTRCPVIELGSDASLNVGQAEAGQLRKSPSVKKNGEPDGTGTGMGWFPGYAVDLETGARLFMAFGENSFYAADGGADMQWNPSDRMIDGTGSPIFGGQHAVYVYGTQMLEINAYQQLENLPNYNPATDETNNLLEQQYRVLENPSSTAQQKSFALKLSVGHLHWIMYPLLEQGEELLSTKTTIKVRVNKMYKDYIATGDNNGRPMYGWSMDAIATDTENDLALAEALKIISVVPNPYYAYSEYERNRIDSRVKITNLPERCTVKIYNSYGKLVKSFKKDSPNTSIDWLLNNNVGIPIASGVYLILIEVPGIGDRVIKSFISMRQVDLQGT